MFNSAKIAYKKNDENNLILSGKDVESNNFSRVQKNIDQRIKLIISLFDTILICETKCR